MSAEPRPPVRGLRLLVVPRWRFGLRSLAGAAGCDVSPQRQQGSIHGFASRSKFFSFLTECRDDVPIPAGPKPLSMSGVQELTTRSHVAAFLTPGKPPV